MPAATAIMAGLFGVVFSSHCCYNYSRCFLFMETAQRIQNSINYKENENDSIVFRIKREFFSKILSKFMNGRDLQLFSFILPTVYLANAYFFPCIRTSENRRLPVKLDSMEVPPHFSFSLSVKINKSIFAMNTDDMKSPYQYIFNSFIPATEYKLDAGICYTVMNLNKITNKSTPVSINAYVK